MALPPSHALLARGTRLESPPIWLKPKGPGDCLCATSTSTLKQLVHDRPNALARPYLAVRLQRRPFPTSLRLHLRCPLTPLLRLPQQQLR